MDGSSVRIVVIYVTIFTCVFMLFSGNYIDETSKREVPRPKIRGKDKELVASAVQHNTIMSGEVVRSAQTTNNTSGEVDIYKSRTNLPCNGSCHFQIQFCGYFTPKLPTGSYCCEETGCTAKFIYSTKFDVKKESDAVILHHAGEWKLQLLLRERRQNQIFIFMAREAGTKIRHKSVLYNMTMTHRFDSDFRVPYGIYTDIHSEKSKDFDKDWTKGKRKLAAWMASNCKLTSWPRTEFVQNLSKLLPIDIFGKCGNKKCENGETCRKILRNYKFYFALENQLCKDYITEKFWYNALSNDVVPIVYGASRSEYEKVAPPNSFIHLNDFANVKEFLDYIQTLNLTPNLYNTYFKWKKHGVVRRLTLHEDFTESLICEIVTKLKQRKDSKDTKYFQMRTDFWDHTCQLNMPPWSA